MMQASAQARRTGICALPSATILRRLLSVCLWVWLALALPACAVREIVEVPPTPTNPPPFIILPPPAQANAGACSLDSRSWEFWLQAAAFQIEGFRQGFAEALELPQGERTGPTLALAALRDQAYRNPTPECGAATQRLLTAAMERGVEVLRASVLDPALNLAAVAGEVNAMLDLAADDLKRQTDALEQQLIAREGASQ
jgi:hypothetical protein